MDEHHGKGGSYVRDKVTGERKLVERTMSIEEVAAEAATADKAAATKPKAKTKAETEGGNSQ